VSAPALSLPPPGARRGWGAAAPLLGILLLAALGFGLRHAVCALHVQDVIAAIAATPPSSLRHAAAWLSAAFAVMMLYDAPGALYARGVPACPQLSALRVALTSFCAYALSHLLGAPALTAAAIRLRLYTGAGLPAAAIARILALSGCLFSTGFVTLCGALLAFAPHALPEFARRLPAPELRGLGVGLLALVFIYVALLPRLTLPRLIDTRLSLPSRRIAFLQVAIGCADTLIAAAILYCVLPAGPDLSFSRVLAVYLAAFAGGLLSGLPAGVGVFDALLLLGLAGHVDTASGLAALLLFRGLYFLIPALLAALAFAVLECVSAWRKAARLAEK